MALNSTVRTPRILPGLKIAGVGGGMVTIM